MGFLILVTFVYMYISLSTAAFGKSYSEFCFFSVSPYSSKISGEAEFVETRMRTAARFLFYFQFRIYCNFFYV